MRALGGDFQFIKSSPDESRQPCETSHVGTSVRAKRHAGATGNQPLPKRLPPKMLPTIFLSEAPARPASRRRDPLGFANVAAYYADMLAPELTNRQRDPRWLTILCWSLQQVASEFPNLSTDADRYARLRGLELRWIIEACRLDNGGKGRQLPGSRNVRDVRKRHGETQFATLRAQMGPEQWRRYRYVGPYASYRGLLQLLGLLDDDGWQLTDAGRKLAAFASSKVTSFTSHRALQLLTDETSGWVSFWLRRWRAGTTIPTSSAFLPTHKSRLGKKEVELFGPALFATDSVRLHVAVAMQGAVAGSHSALCQHLQASLLILPGWSSDEKIRLAKLGAFAVLADVAIDAIKAAFEFVARHPDGTCPPKVAAAAIKAQLGALHIVCKRWGCDGIWPVVDQFAKAVGLESGPEKVLLALVRFHQQNAGGLLWVRLSGGCLDKAVRHSQAPGGFYRFRLETLSRLAFGCHIIDTLPACFEQTRLDPEDGEDCYE